MIRIHAAFPISQVGSLSEEELKPEYNDNENPKILQKHAADAAEGILSFICWAKTKEGHDFWASVYFKLKAYAEKKND